MKVKLGLESQEAGKEQLVSVCLRDLIVLSFSRE